MSKIASGIYPVMITPFTADNQVDYEAVDQMMEFYARGGCQGVFAVCQSSEMFCLTEEERVKLAARVVKAAAGRMCVVASGHISDRMEDQIRELRRVSETGVDAVVMISNRLAGKDEPDEVLIQNMHRILDAIPGVTFGMYECPYPYKRLLTPKVLEAMAETGRFTFIKDTCCDADLIARRIALLHGRIQLFNANCATALETLQSGADGFSGIMANFHPDLLVWMYENYRQQPEKARQLSAMLSVMSMAEGCQHPIGAKYHMNLVGVPMELRCRVKNADCFDKMDRHTIEDLKTMEEVVRQWLKA
ncbi:MAG: dihydrodipicolinate synthase family protein [Eubacteriales bacterium]|nr:dihydrodipicolinate synthase family protein [Eubacteriales bacterium]